MVLPRKPQRAPLRVPARSLAGRMTVRSLIGAAVLTIHIVAIGPSFLGRWGGGTLESAFSTAIEVVLLPSTTQAQPLAAATLRRIKLAPMPLPEMLVGADSPPGLGNEPGKSEPRDEPYSPPFERLIVEARPQDANWLRYFCNGSYPPQSRSANEQDGTVVLLVRIEPDGHVSDTTVEESSGSPRLDRVTQACVMASPFEPARSGWSAVPSWQRIRWNWSKP
jgi:TonB family protein